MDEMNLWLPSATPMFSDRLLSRRSCRVGSPITDRTVPASAMKKCARQLSFAACNIPPDTTHAGDAGVHSMAVSNAVRTVTVDTLAELHTGGRWTVACGVPVKETFGTPHGPITVTGIVDMVTIDPDGNPDTAVFVVPKTGYGYQMTTVGDLSYRAPETPATGPSDELVFSAAVRAGMAGAGRAVIVHVPLEPLHEWRTNGTVGLELGAEWVLELDDVAELVDSELARIARVVQFAEQAEPVVAKRVIPGAQEIAGFDPKRKGVWTDQTGQQHVEWQCSYCPWQPTCHSVGPGTVDAATIIAGDR
jgi:hypothetical protein